MPYTEVNRKEAMRKGDHAHCAGELNYALTTAIIQYLLRHRLSYQAMNDIVGALVKTGDEFRSRIWLPAQFLPTPIQEAGYKMLFLFVEMLREQGKLFERLVEPRTVMELRHFFTMLCYQYLGNNGVTEQTTSDVIGAIDLANKEFCRRIVYPYEDQKIRKNGDVYPEELLAQARGKDE